MHEQLFWFLAKVHKDSPSTANKVRVVYLSKYYANVEDPERVNIDKSSIIRVSPSDTVTRGLWDNKFVRIIADEEHLIQKKYTEFCDLRNFVVGKTIADPQSFEPTRERLGELADSFVNARYYDKARDVLDFLVSVEQALANSPSTIPALTIHQSQTTQIPAQLSTHTSTPSAQVPAQTPTQVQGQMLQGPAQTSIQTPAQIPTHTPTQTATQSPTQIPAQPLPAPIPTQIPSHMPPQTQLPVATGPVFAEIVAQETNGIGSDQKPRLEGVSDGRQWTIKADVLTEPEVDDQDGFYFFGVKLL